MTGPEIHEAIGIALAAAIQPLRDDIKELAKSINGNGTPGLKSRLTRLETIVALLASVIVLSVSVGSCAVNNGYLVVPTKTVRAK